MDDDKIGMGLFDEEGGPAPKAGPRRLFVVDGYGMIYRSYFAFVSRPLTDAEGRNVSALHGFFNTLMKILSDHRPDCLVVALDAAGKTFRHKLFPEYKANRDKAPEDLHAQVPMILSVLDAVGIPYRMQEGMEADDIIATLSRGAESQGWETVVVTGDKDLMQLVGDKVAVLRPPRKGEKDYTLCRAAEVAQLFGVRPDQMIDYLTIVGDASDNVPGIRGVGPKGAQKLLAQYGSLEEVYKHLDDLTPKMRERFVEAQGHLDLSHTLIVLKDDLFPVGDLEKESFGAKPLDWTRAIDLFRSRNLKTLASMASRLGGGGQAPAATGAPEPVRVPAARPAPLPQEELPVVTMAPDPQYTAITSLEELDRTLEEAVSGGAVALDTETTSLDAIDADLVGLSFCSDPGRAFYVPIVAGGKRILEPGPVLEIFRRRLKGTRIIGQNLKYDYNVLRRAGLELERLDFDTMIAAWLLDSDSRVYNLDDLSDRMLGHQTVRFDDVVPKGEGFESVPLEDAVRYAAEDSAVAWALAQALRPRLQRAGLLGVLEEIEMPLVKTIADMESAGALLDPKRIAALSETLADEQAKVEEETYRLCSKTFNINSPKQLQEVLFFERKLQTGKRTRSGYSTDSEILQKLEATSGDPVPGLILRSRFLTKLQGYCKGLPPLINPRTGRIHPSFLQTSTATGRLSCKDPNLQNIPIRTEEGRLVRSAFPAAPGTVLLSADYSQIELVVLAHYSGDPALLEAFRNGEDVHRRTASMIFETIPELVTAEQRRIAKTINFGVIYGMSPYRLSNELHVPYSKAKSFIDSYFHLYKGVRDFVERTCREAERDLEVRTMFGHRRPVPQIASSNKVEQAAAQRIAVNTVIQGTAAEIMKKAMIAIGARMRREGLGSRLILQVHDELIFEVPFGETERMRALVEEEMAGAARLSAPLRCSIETGADWGEMH